VSYRCDGCGASLGAREDLDREAGVTRRSWSCTYCGVSVPARVAERLQHERDGAPTDRR
jgi:DNA-directed RNA polymerase subunit RPC12/RpoP